MKHGFCVKSSTYQIFDQKLYFQEHSFKPYQTILKKAFHDWKYSQLHPLYSSCIFQNIHLISKMRRFAQTNEFKHLSKEILPYIQ
ncbi:unnamed protein product [Paramecium octaurelia]|uniref:Uncharacterized protein n=1 Tax=Paramecium octaurelia TaxID=43137 RepID=A0A8S1W9L5_PAROT|nr:unnamed protein product [Paramecium octaurelia]